MKRSACILVSSNDFSFLSSCGQFFSACGVHVVYVENDGKKVLEAIKRCRPDIVILNAIMPFFDASSVIYISHEFKFTLPKFVVLANTENPEVEKENFEMGASEYILMPSDHSLIFSRVLKLLSYINWHSNKNIFEISAATKETYTGAEQIDTELLVTKLILNLGVPSHVSGYGYLREAVLICLGHPSVKFNVTKNIYPVIAKMNNSTPARIERSMRHAISIAWNGGSEGDCVMKTELEEKPTNSQFIALILNEVRLTTSAKQVG